MHSILVVTKIFRCLLIFPYDISKPTSKKLTVLRLAICAVIAFIGLSEDIFSIYLHIPVAHAKPTAYFELLFCICFLFCRYYVFKLIFLQKREIHFLHENFSRFRLYPSSSFSQQNILMHGSTVISMLLFLWDRGRSFIGFDANLIVRIVCGYQDAFVSNFTFVFSYVSAQSLSNCIDTLLLSLFEPNETCVLEKNCNPWNELTDKMHVLEDIAVSVNKLTGNLLMCNIMLTLLYFSIGFDKVVANAENLANVSENLWFLFFFTSSLVYLYTCASIPRKMEKIKVWLSRNGNMTLPNNPIEFSMMLNKIDSHVISVKAGGVFPVTFSLLVSVSFSNPQ